MKRGVKSSAHTAGFTIVETMIVLAVTGVLFISIAATWFGRQHRTEFQTSAQEMRSRLQQVISDVQNGYFPNQNNFSCSGNTQLLAPPPIGKGEQGTNYPCVFLGKVVQFHLGTTDPEQYRVYTVAADGSKTTLSAANPTVVAPSNLTSSTFPDNSDSGILHYGLSLIAYNINNTGVVKIGPATDIAVGFFSTLGQLDGNNAYVSGTQQVNLYTFKEPSIPDPSSASNAPNAINTAMHDSTSYVINSPTALCFQSGGTDQFAVITIGGNNSTLTADLSLREGTCNADF